MDYIHIYNLIIQLYIIINHSDLQKNKNDYIIY